MKKQLKAIEEARSLKELKDALLEFFQSRPEPEEPSVKEQDSSVITELEEILASGETKRGLLTRLTELVEKYG